MSGKSNSKRPVSLAYEDVVADLLLSNSKDEALAIAIRATEALLKSMKLAQDPEEKASISGRVKRLLADAERIKSDDGWKANLLSSAGLPPQPTMDSLKVTRSKSVELNEAQNSRSLPKSEQILLYKASYVGGNKFAPWTGTPSVDEFQPLESKDLFTDDVHLSLSPSQQRFFAGWQRPSIALTPASRRRGEQTNVPPTMMSPYSIELVQDASTDCSVVASLCAGIARAQRGHHRLMGSVLHPFDSDIGAAMLSKNGKYIVRLNFNGCYRRVVIDDRLPTSTTDRVIHVVDRNNPGLLWPALIEKAYLKVRGGYDFPGSNSATDLWVMTGWIPEQVFLQSDELDLDRLWKRTFNSFNFGDVMITMGTGKISPKVEKEIGLAGEHDYAVLDLREVDGQRLMLVKNPWAEGSSWHGICSKEQDERSNLDARQSEKSPRSTEVGTEGNLVRSPRDLLNADDQLSPGTFWMDVDNVVQHFESIYLNWNPGLFAFRQDIHFTWNLSGDTTDGRGRHVSLYSRPQFTVSARADGAIWLLLCRHLQGTPPHSESARPEADLSGFMSIYAFDAGGRMVKLPERALRRANFIDSPQILIKLDDCKANTVYTIVPAEQELSATTHTFTISAFSNAALSLDHATKHFNSSLIRSAAWTKDTAGGNAHSATYTSNPQFSIVLARRSRLSLLLEADKDELNVHVKLVHGKGQRVRAIRNRDILFDSSDYRRRCCVATSDDAVEAGTYTIICSTFEPQQTGTFKLLVESDDRVDVSLLPREGAGRLCIESRTAFAKDSIQITAPLIPRRLVNIYARARPASIFPGTHPHVRMSIEHGRGSQRRILLASGEGEFISTAAGPVQTDSIDLSPDMLRHGELSLVLARMRVVGQTRDEGMIVDLFVDQPDAIICGDWVAYDD